MVDKFVGEDELRRGVNAGKQIVARTTGAVSEASDLLLAPDHVGKALGTVSGFSNGFSLLALLGFPALARASKWKPLSKIPVLGRLLGAGGALAEVNEVTLKDMPFKTREAFHLAGERLGVGQSTFNVLGGLSEKAHTGIGKYAQRTLGSHSLGARALNGLGNTSVSNAIFGGTLVVGEGANMAMTAARRIRVLRQMEADITGKPAPSPFAVIMGNHLNPLVMQARKELMGNKAALGTLIQIGGVIGNIWLFVRNTSLMKQLAFGLGTAGVGSLLASGDTILTAYDNLHKDYAQMGRGTLEDYQGVIDGYIKNGDNRVLQNFAKQCVEEHVSPPELLRRITVLKKTVSQKAPVLAHQAPTPTIGINTARVNARRMTQPSADVAIVAS